MNSLHWYLLRRLVLLLFVTVAVLTILFVMFKLLPGNPLSVFIDSNFPEEMIRRQKQLWGLDDPLWLKYVRYMWNMLTFNFGTSFFQMTPVRDIVVEKPLHTGAMIVPAVVLSVVLGRCSDRGWGWRRGSRREGAVGIGLLALRSAVRCSSWASSC
jgi:peptide/nickel transport system permease protein